MDANTRRNSIIKVNPTITIVDTVEPTKNDNKIASCCFCVPERVGVVAILSLYFFFGTISSLFLFVDLSGPHDSVDLIILVIDVCLSSSIAISSILSMFAIKKENAVMMRRLSIVFWIITVLKVIFNLSKFILRVVSKNTLVEECNEAVIENYGPDSGVDCNGLVNNYLTTEGIKFFFIGLISIYFAHVVFRFAKVMRESNRGLPFTTSDGQKTPTYVVYSAQPPTSNSWVPPPTYSVTPSDPLPEGFKAGVNQAS